MEVPDILRDVFMCLKLYELKFTRLVSKSWDNFYRKEYGVTLNQKLLVEKLSILKLDDNQVTFFSI